MGRDVALPLFTKEGQVTISSWRNIAGKGFERGSVIRNESGPGELDRLAQRIRRQPTASGLEP